MALPVPTEKSQRTHPAGKVPGPRTSLGPRGEEPRVQTDPALQAAPPVCQALGWAPRHRWERRKTWSLPSRG